MIFGTIVFANNPREAYMNADFEEHTFDKKEWKELTKDLDYSEEPEKEITPKDKKEVEFNPPSELGGMLKVIAIILAIIVAVVVLLHLLGMDMNPRNRKIKKDSPEIDIENIEEYIHETELERFIREAIEGKNFPLAIRLYYLETIKQLSLKKLIKWKKDKTNGEYLRELRGSDFHKPFRELTLVFERIWYGKTEISEDDFKEIEPKFKKKINRILNHNKSV